MENTWNRFVLLRQEHYLNDNSEGFDKLLDGLGTPALFTGLYCCASEHLKDEST